METDTAAPGADDRRTSRNGVCQSVKIPAEDAAHGRMIRRVHDGEPEGCGVETVEHTLAY